MNFIIACILANPGAIIVPPNAPPLTLKGRTVWASERVEGPYHQVTNRVTTWTNRTMFFITK